MENHTSSGSRATTVEELEAILNKTFDSAGRERGLAFTPRPDDVIISPYAKCGTTWLQHIAHGLRTGGSMEFDEITDVTPWIEVAHDVGWNLDAPQVAEPRVFKSHLSWHDIPKGGRYICAFRDPQEALVSFYRFFEGWLFEPGTISLETLTAWRWPRDKVDRQGYWYHLSSWWEQRHNKNVLLLCYEDMKADLPGTVQKIAHFLGITPDDTLLNTVTRQSTREFMLAHKHRFNSGYMQQVSIERANLPQSGDSYKVTPGTADEDRYKLSPAIRQTLDDIWQEQITPRFGFETYEDLRQSLRRLHQLSNGWDGVESTDNRQAQ